MNSSASPLQEHFRHVFDHLTDAVFLTDPESEVITDCNRQAEIMLRRSREELLGLHPSRLHPPGHEDEIRSMFHGEEKVNFDTEVARSDERNLPVSIKASLINIEGKDRFLMVYREISDYQQTGDELKILRRLIDQSGDAIHVIDPITGRFLDVNDHACNDLGFSREELLRMHVFQIKADQKEIDRWACFMDEVMKEGGRIVESRHRRKDGSSYPVESNVTLATLEEKSYLLETVRDITERQHAELQLRETIAKLAHSNQELEQFAYVASHDLQEPLRMVGSYLQLLARRYKGRLDDDADDFIGFAVEGAGRMQTLINDLLTFSRLGRSEKPSERTDCEEVLEQVKENLKVAIEESGAEITCGPLPTLEADESQLMQLFQNLIGNSLKFSGDKAPFVHISATKDGPDHVFSVRDNGIGIEPQYFQRIFKIFQRLHNRNEYPGTGIGLALCKRIVERHGGKIWLESESGQGTAFHFSLKERESNDK